MSAANRYRLMVENAGEGIFLSDESGRYVEVNRRAETLSGYTREELLSMTVGDLAGSGEMDTPEDYAEFHAQLAARGQWSVNDRKLRRKDGSILSVDVEAVYLEDGTVMCLVRDMTDRRWAEAALRESLERYRRLFEDSRDAIYITDSAGAFIDVNDSLSELVGWTREELIGRSALSLYADEEDRSPFHLELQQRGGVRDHEVTLRAKDGRLLECLVSSAVLRDAERTVIGYQGILHDITERKRAERQLLHNAFHDGLTGLPNRALFMDRLERLIRHAKRHREYCFAVLFLDVDRFKLVNDSLGHLVGDKLLVLIARRLETCLRQEDTVARLGGDEFAILLDSIDDVVEAKQVADRVKQELTVAFEVEAHEVFTNVSIGIALSSTGYDRPEDVLRDADTAMYRAKAAGAARYEVFDKHMHAQVVAQLQLETDLRRALDRDQFEMHYQPILNLETSSLVGFEALVRWRHPEHGLLWPSSFISLAEETGLILPLGWHAISAALRQLAIWQEQSAELGMSVNLSARQILQPDFFERLEKLRVDSNVAHGLDLEITESVFMENAEYVSTLLARLRGSGIRLCIDDFGTGYSSLSYLQRYRVDSLKIDRSFVTGIGVDGSNLALVNTIVALARNLGMEAIAEGVETQEQLAALRTLGTRYAQGFLISRPLTAEAATERLGNGRFSDFAETLRIPPS